ncbi:cyclic pyranopterin phosphate synthase [Pseudoduganella flava]|uniref:GTP 3',8-cyclase n=1 Tax=Pseudoduganella flava TaxID=871742 RepID=A0A562PC43_9BURK|nr:GTP 3',8-cyclase MoaA [Pseudoduganella flava]QGZ37979.1 GTP 3',8-cyclase MoaA [Pseudoduganella flava]TWI41800.1 cyclic pyranopterin phosphate synthase [Pseudoduganella flava]
MLTDRFGRTIDYLRVSVTDRCDLRCTYCLPQDFKGFEEPPHWLTQDEIVRVVRAFTRMGTRRVRLTGGEPLTRGHLPELAARLAALPGLRDLSLSTNGTRLARHAAALKAAGISRINVSLDSLDRSCMKGITGRDCLPAILAGLEAARAEGLAPIKINMVAMRGVNEHEIEEMAAFCIARGFLLRLIEAMPMGDTGRATEWLDLGPVRDRLVQRFGLVPQARELGGGPARYYSTADGGASVGFITPMSQHFCATCNRVRMSVDGTLYLCLGQEEKFELRPLLRGGADDVELERAIRAAIELKPREHDFTRQPEKIVRFMSQTGG